jgi:uncharacterized protein (TIGR03790 family)
MSFPRSLPRTSLIRGRESIFILLVFSGLLGHALAARAGLSPDQVAVLANKNSPEGLMVARHYAEKRGIPPAHLIELDLQTDEGISRGNYEAHVAEPLREALNTRNLASTVRVLVTTYGVPLTVFAKVPSADEERWLKDAAERQRFAEAHLERALEWLGTIAPSGNALPVPPAPEQTGPDDALMARLDRAMKAAVKRLKAVTDRKQLDQWTAELARLTKTIGGPAALVQNLTPSPGTDKAQADRQLAQLKQQVLWTQHAIQVLQTTPSDDNRARAYKLAERGLGLLGMLRVATEEIASLSQKGSDASLDSELSILWWEPDSYRPAGRIGNPLYHAYRPRSGSGAPPQSVLMVSRLDGPTPEIAAGLVDKALAAEATGLKGKAYIDAQGMNAQPAPGSYGYYDQSLRDLAGLLTFQTRYEVILENTEQRFSRPGEAPDTALYAGWYKLRAYEDAFDFRPGAIGYHLASAEAVSLRDPEETGWCKNALERGITATMGSTGEPFLDSFPPPQEFFGLLLTGRFSLVEAYYSTARYVSWRMVLIGDPLYNPWKKKGLIPETAVTLSSGPNGQASRPLPPSELHFPDPIETSRSSREQRQAFFTQVDRLLSEVEKQDRHRKTP